MMKLFILISLVMLILISIFLLSKVSIQINYHHSHLGDMMLIKLRVWKGLIHFSKEVQLSDEKYQPYSYRESFYQPLNQSSYHEFSKKIEPLSMDDVQAAFQHLKEMLTQWKGYQSSIKRITSKIQITNLQVEVHYGTGEAPSTALATGALWSLSGGVIGIISQYFLLLTQPKIDIIPNFSVKIPLDTKIECIARLRIAKTILAGWKLARLLLKK